MVQFYSPPKKSLLPKKLMVTIDRLDAFGQGIAMHQNKPIFINNALPGETVEIQFTESKKQYSKARVITYHHCSNNRQTPDCPHYGKCGGCQMQHIDLSTQQQIKRQAFIHAMRKETGITLAESDVAIITSPPYHYRRRARLAIMFEHNKVQIGFRAPESNHIINIQSCPVLVHELEQLITPLRHCVEQIQDKRALGHIELMHVDSGTIVVLRHTKPLCEHDKQQLLTFATQNNVSLYLHGQALVHLAGHDLHYYYVDDLELMFSPLDFIQVNSNINLQMIKQAIHWLELNENDSVLDLFCGMGNFSFPIAKIAKRVIGVEGVSALVEKATSNITVNHDRLKGEISFFVGDLELTDKTPIWYHNDINKVLLDPARLGAYQVMNIIAERKPEKIVYISCNPATLARDSQLLLQADYQISQSMILDMFPQTKHIESMLLFTQIGRR